MCSPHLLWDTHMVSLNVIMSYWVVMQISKKRLTWILFIYQTRYLLQSTVLTDELTWRKVYKFFGLFHTYLLSVCHTSDGRGRLLWLSARRYLFEPLMSSWVRGSDVGVYDELQPSGLNSKPSRKPGDACWRLLSMSSDFLLWLILRPRRWR